MKSNDSITLIGKVIDILPGTKFKVEFKNKHSIIGYLSGKLKVNMINICVGDQVKVEINPMNLTTGKIVYRYNSKSTSVRKDLTDNTKMTKNSR